ncbi:MAG: hypothetical protein ABFS09_02940 [Thermodesulfobacteriota bacterium]
MVNYIAAKEFSLPSRTVIKGLADGNYARIMDRKNRIIMADGRKILEKANQIALKKPGAKVCLKTSAPVCGKTGQFLAQHGITLHILS